MKSGPYESSPAAARVWLLCTPDGWLKERRVLASWMTCQAVGFSGKPRKKASVGPFSLLSSRFEQVRG